VREIGHDAARHLAHDGEDRPLGRLADGRVGAVGGARHRGTDEHRVDELPRAADELLGRAADELGEDHAAVAARAQQRGAGDRVDDLLAPDVVEQAPAVGGEPVELVEHRPQGQRHVVPGVAVGDREHVEVVDLLAARFEVGEPGFEDVPEANEAWVRHRGTPA
jgi:hypothetical protein